MIEDRLQNVLQEYKTGLKQLLGETVERILLYGSHARGDARQDSDIDILCIMRNPFQYGNLIRQTSELTAQLSLKYDVTLSRAFALADEFDRIDLPFYVCARRESIPL